MKVFITVDYEGVSGQVQWGNGNEREAMTADINAAIAGAIEGGATEILAGEAHANMRNIIPEKLDPRASFLSGQPKPLNHVGGIDSTFDAAMLVAYHAKAGTLRGIMAHTYTGKVFSLKFNDIEVGEIGADAAIAGYFGIPVVMVSGDVAACDEARALLGDIETVAVKEGVSRSAGRCINLEEARELIRKGAKQAMGLIGTAKPFVIEPPIRTQIVFTNPSYADNLEYLPFIERIDGCTVAFTTEDFVEAFELFNMVQFYSGSVK
ncbi:M55 family metallopeptidase [Candidatus Poribacteria bacterium]